MRPWLAEFVPPRELFEFGSVTVYWYSIALVAGIAAAYLVARSYYRRASAAVQTFEDAFFITVLAGIIAARLWHVFIFQWGYYSAHPAEIIRIWEGGIAIQGGILGGAVALAAFCWRKRQSFWKLADAFAIGLPLGQAIGRWGNFFNQELYGRPAELPWSIFIEPYNRVPGFESFSYFHPAFLYESALNVILFFVLLRLSKKNLPDGRLFAFYLAGYGIIRFLVDFVRIDPMPVFAGLRYSQWVSLLLLAAAVLYARGAALLPKKS